MLMASADIAMAQQGVSITQGGNTALVKAGNTAAAGDQAAVVADPNVLGAIQGSQPAGTNRIGYVSDDLCNQRVKTNLSIATVSSNLQLIAGVSSEKISICSISLIVGSSTIVSLIEGTGTNCVTTNEAAVIGSTTPTLGLSLAANGGLTYGSGHGTVAATVTTANGLCVQQSTAALISGNLTYVQSS
jgi:hypothetical protein